MKKIILFILFINFIFIPDAFSKPVIEITKKNPVYTKIDEGFELIHVFKVKNKGDELLKIAGVQARG